MMFRNSHRMLLANFGTFWKDFLYKLIVCGIVVLLTLPVLNALSKVSAYHDLLTEAENLFITFPFSNIEAFIQSSFQLFNIVIEFISDLFINFFWQGLHLATIYLLVLPFLFNLSELAVSEVLYGNMATNTKYNYSASFIKTLPRALLLSLFKAFANAVTLLFVCVAVYGVLFLGVNSLVPILLIPMLIVLAICFIIGLKITVLSGWAPSMVVFNTGVLDGFKKGMKAVGRRFFKVLSTSFMIMLVSVIIAGILGVSSLILLLPITKLFIVIFGMIMFFGSQGMRYYVDPDTILSPKKLEETDKLVDAKNII